ncbi:MAG: hypothetical protein ACRC10_09655 [Thermoguttaceae bacterium]
MSNIPPLPPEFLDTPPAIVDYVEMDSRKTPAQLAAELQDCVQGIGEGIVTLADAARRKREREAEE